MSHIENAGHPEFEALIDSYLLGRLNSEETERFEKHYFDCPECFRLTAERAVLIDAVKTAGPAPAAAVRRDPGTTRGRRFPFGWAAAGAALLLAAAAAVVFLPRRSEPPSFTDSGNRIVRGGPVEVVAPSGLLQKTPDKFVWRPAAGAAEYMIIVEGIDPVWTAQTRDTEIKIPADIAGRMIPGRLYVWGVKAFSAEGTLVGASASVTISIAR